MSESNKRLAELEGKLKEDPQADQFYEYAVLLKDDGRAVDARNALLAGLSKHQEHAAARLLLAQLYYQEGWGEFCVRELVELKKYVKSPALDKLIDAFGEYAHPFLQSSSENRTAGLVDDEDSEADSEARVSALEDAKDDEEDVLAEIDIDADFDEIFDEIDD